jgi:hypothetical protein
MKKFKLEDFLILVFFFLIFLILIFIVSCSSSKQADIHEETTEADIIHEVKFKCDLKKKKECEFQDKLEITRDTGFKKPIFKPSDSLLDNPAVQGALGK